MSSATTSTTLRTIAEVERNGPRNLGRAEPPGTLREMHDEWCQRRATPELTPWVTDKHSGYPPYLLAHWRKSGALAASDCFKERVRDVPSEGGIWFNRRAALANVDPPSARIRASLVERWRRTAKIKVVINGKKVKLRRRSAACALLGISINTFDRWCDPTTGCPVLPEGRPLRTYRRKLKNQRNRTATYAYEDDLQQAKKALDALPIEPTSPFAYTDEQLMRLTGLTRNGVAELGLPKVAVLYWSAKPHRHVETAYLISKQAADNWLATNPRPTVPRHLWPLALAAKKLGISRRCASKLFDDGVLTGERSVLPTRGGDREGAKLVTKARVKQLLRSFANAGARTWTQKRACLKRLREKIAGRDRPARWAGNGATVTPPAESRKAAPKNKGGRPPEAGTQKVYRRCYELYVNCQKSSAATMEIVNREFGKGTIEVDSSVRINARRYAEKHGLPRKGEVAQKARKKREKTA